MHLRVSVTPALDQGYRSKFIVDTEHAVLAVLLLDPGRIAEVAAVLEPVDFAGEANRTIYAAM